MHLIIACSILIASGQTEMPPKEDKCKKLLMAAGCSDGKLLDKNVCIRNDYNGLIPPNSSNKVDIKFSHWPQILGIDEAESTIDNKNQVLGL